VPGATHKEFLLSSGKNKERQSEGQYPVILHSPQGHRSVGEIGLTIPVSQHCSPETVKGWLPVLELHKWQVLGLLIPDSRLFLAPLLCLSV
jgi:hypothetical protein